MNNEYKFLTRWRFRANAPEIYDIISDPLQYPRWWPSVYLQTTEAAVGDEHGTGRRIRYHAKGWLPYTLRWESVATQMERPRCIAIRAFGDFNGRGIWTFEQDGEFVNAAFDWQLTADKPLVRALSFLLKPIFSANHVWAMARGKESLDLELARRHAETPEARSRIPAPPGPNKTSRWWVVLAAIAVLAILIALYRML